MNATPYACGAALTALGGGKPPCSGAKGADMECVTGSTTATTAPMMSSSSPLRPRSTLSSHYGKAASCYFVGLEQTDRAITPTPNSSSSSSSSSGGGGGGTSSSIGKGLPMYDATTNTPTTTSTTKTTTITVAAKIPPSSSSVPKSEFLLGSEPLRSPLFERLTLAKRAARVQRASFDPLDLAPSSSFLTKYGGNDLKQRIRQPLGRREDVWLHCQSNGSGNPIRLQSAVSSPSILFAIAEEEEEEEEEEEKEARTAAAEVGATATETRKSRRGSKSVIIEGEACERPRSWHGPVPKTKDRHIGNNLKDLLRIGKKPLLPSKYVPTKRDTTKYTVATASTTHHPGKILGQDPSFTTTTTTTTTTNNKNKNNKNNTNTIMTPTSITVTCID